MYVPAAFAERDQGRLHAFMERHSFALLVSTVEGALFATHLPLLLRRQAGTHGTLIGHMARANPQWRELEDRLVLAIFSGPHAYISPAWYEAEHVVPTWNYTAVHAYGRARLIQDSAGLLEIVQDSVAVYEGNMPRPWTLSGGDSFVGAMLAQIVGFHIEIEKIEGKFKLNQNHPAERREKVVRALEEQGGEERALAALMREQIRDGEEQA